MIDMQAEARKLLASRSPAPATPVPPAKPVIAAKPPAPVLDKAKALACLAAVEARAKALRTPNIGANEAIVEARTLLLDSADFSAAVEAGNFTEAERIDRVLKARGAMPIPKRINAIDWQLTRAETFVGNAAKVELEEQFERERKERLVKLRSGPRGRS